MSIDGTLRDMTNERIRRAMLRAGFDIATLAASAEVSEKSVERWIRGDVVPYPRTRFRVAASTASTTR
jgi:ribosome-binding protein aMBF1 (putative translation factor)